MKVRNPAGLPVIAEGGEGVLYEYHGEVLKCFKPGVDTEAKKRKIRLLMKKALPEEVVRPSAEAYDRKRQFIGYTMDKVSGEEFRMLSNRRFVNAARITTKDILGMLVRLQKVLEQLHSQNIYVGDLNDQNILFDQQFNIYLIDCDSWTIEEERCDVAMDLFCDPQLSGNDFNEKTDTYAFCVLAWKALTRIHPFGGTMDPDLNLMERKTRGISVIGRPEVKIPRTVRSWRNLSPELLSAMKAVFENDVRILGTELADLYSNLKYCQTDAEYYYGKYMTCPLCDAHARLIVKPASAGVMDGLKLTVLLNLEEVRTVLNERLWLTKDDQIMDLQTGGRIPYETGRKYYFTTDGIPVVDDRETFMIKGREDNLFEKKFRSSIILEENRIYFLNRQNSLCEVTVHSRGNSIRRLCQCANIAYFHVSQGKCCVLNLYDDRLILHMDGYHCEIPHRDAVLNYGLHYDPVSGCWLVLLENSIGSYRTLIVDRTTVLYDTDEIRYDCPLNSVCLFHRTIFLPLDGQIRGYAYEKDQYRDFKCDVVNTDSRLLRRGRKFVIINHENIYELGQ